MLALALLALAAIVPSAFAQAPGLVQPYGHNDYGDGGFRNILPPGQCRNASLADILANQAGGPPPAICDDQRGMYEDLVYATPGLGAGQIGDYYKDGSFGTKPADVVRTYDPGPGVTVQRDKFNVPHVYGENRARLMFGAGYVGAEDRLFFMDVLRHAGRAQLSSFAGGANKAMDAEVWANSPYTEADLQKQIDLADDVYGAHGAQLQQDLANYVAGINKYVGEARIDPAKMPGEYALILRPLGPTDWKGTDVIATAALVGGIFGKGGGGELGNAAVFNSAVAKFGTGAGTQVWQDFRSANDPEAPTTVKGTAFPYQQRTSIDPASVAIPDQGSVIDTSGDGQPSLGGLLSGLGGLLGGSNSAQVSAAESASGRPLSVFGPQASYFSPQILMEQDLHAPDFDARGVAFVGVNLFVLLGRGQDFAWSATSAGQDIIDTFAEKLCEPGGGTPTINSQGYLWKGQCRPIETLERVNVIVPTPADQSPPQTYTLRSQRTVHGIITKRGTVGGVPVAFAKLRSTYFHEADSARGLSDFNQPSKVAWWTKALDAAFRPQLGDDLFNNLKAQIGFDDTPREQGSAYQAGWYGFLQKDLRNLLGEPVVGPYSRGYCGAGNLAACRDVLVATLRTARDTPYSTLYPATGGNTPGCLDGGGGDAQMCHDAVGFRAVGGIGVNDIHWINRPTFQQAIEIFRHRPRGGGDGGPNNIDCVNQVIGSKRGDLLNGSDEGDNLLGKRGADRIVGNGGPDCLRGGKARDRLHGGSGIDQFSGGAGRDRIKAIDGVAETVSCGKGRDRAFLDASDTPVGCEKKRVVG